MDLKEENSENIASNQELDSKDNKISKPVHEIQNLDKHPLAEDPYYFALMFYHFF